MVARRMKEGEKEMKKGERKKVLKHIYTLAIGIVLFSLLAVPAMATGEITATRDISIQTVKPGDTFTVTVTIVANKDVEALALDEDLPDGWEVTSVENDGGIFKKSTVEWIWTEKLSAGDSKTVIYNVTVPPDAKAGTYYIKGHVSAYGVNPIAVGGESEVIVIRENKLPIAFEIGDYNMTVGGTATIPIEIKGVTDLGAATIEIHYDPSVINVKSVDEGDLGGTLVPNINTPGIVRLVWYTTTGQSGNFTFARLNVSAVNEGTTELGIVVKTCADSNGNPIPTSVNNGTVIVTNVTIGDANGDGKVTVVDAMFIAQYVAGIRAELPNPAAADVNGDGEINVIDAMFIAQYIAGLRPSLG